MIVEIKGVQFTNKGAELMLQAILKKMLEYDSDVQFCLAPNVNSPYKKRAELGAFQKISFRKNIFDLNGLTYLLPKSVRRYFLNTWGIVSEADVDVVLDASGFAYGDQWSDLILRQTAQEVKRLKAKSKIYVFMPQALGPFSGEGNKKWAKIAFDNATLTFAREVTSFSEVEKLKPAHSNFHQAPDFTNLLSSEVDVPAMVQGAVAIIPNSKMLSNKNKNKHWGERYKTVLLSIISELIKRGESVYLLNHEGQADGDICNDINAALKEPLPVFHPNDALEVKAYIGMSKFVVCSRYHGCVSAISQGIPCMATSWSHKYEELFKEYGISHLLIGSELSLNEFKFMVDNLEMHLREEKDVLNIKAESFKKQSVAMWDKVFEILPKKK